MDFMNRAGIQLAYLVRLFDRQSLIDVTCSRDQAFDMR